MADAVYNYFMNWGDFKPAAAPLSKERRAA